MKSILNITRHSKYTKYLTKDLKGGYPGNYFLATDVYLNEKGPSA